MTDVPNDLGPVSSISAGFGANTCTVKTDRTAQCWALNAPATVPADLGIVSSISAGYDYFCAFKTDSSMKSIVSSACITRNLPSSSLALR